MGVRLSSLHLDSAAIENGEWVEDPLHPGLRFRVRSYRCTAFRAGRQAALQRAAEALAPGEKLSGELLDQVTQELTVKALLLDWDGLLDEEDKPIAFSPETAQALFAHPDAILLREALERCVAQVGQARARVAEQTAGN